MEILAYIAVGLLIIVIGIYLSRYMYSKYDFEVFSLKSLGLMLLSVIAWVLVYFYYEPGTAPEIWIEIMAGAFTVILGVLLPLYVLIRNIRQSNIFWGCLAFIYQLAVCVFSVLLVLAVVARLLDD